MKLKEKMFKKTDHVWGCSICKDMEERGYREERLFMRDFFDKKLRPIKYKLKKI